MVRSRFIPFVFALLVSNAALAAPAPALQEANQAFKQGRHQLALDRTNAFLATNPKDAQARFLKGLALTELNRAGEAIRVFSELAEEYPELPEPHNNLAVLYAAQGQYDRAKNSLEMAIRTHPSYATAHENLGDIYAKLASQAYDKALQLDKSNRSAQTKLSMVKEMLGPTRVAEPARTKPANKPKTLTPASEPTTVTASNPIASPPQAASTPDAQLAAEVERRIRAWAEAWSRRDVSAYLSFYSEQFNPGDKDRASWAEERQGRLTRPKYIRIEIGNLEIGFSDGRAVAQFRQQYESNLYKDTGSKTLILERQDGRWMIVEER